MSKQRVVRVILKHDDGTEEVFIITKFIFHYVNFDDPCYERLAEVQTKDVDEPTWVDHYCFLKPGHEGEHICSCGYEKANK